MAVAQTAPETVMRAADEASLYLQATLTAAWAPPGQTPTVQVDPSRTKTNFYGSLNLQTGQERPMRAEQMNAQTTADYLEHILQAIPNRPIPMFWDRAPWHHGAPIRRVLEAHPRLELIEFPVAAPELNPQELLWHNWRDHITHNYDRRRMCESERDSNHYFAQCDRHPDEALPGIGSPFAKRFQNHRH